jgi:thiamine-monophosphate kinase
VEVRDLGEFGLIDRLQKALGRPPGDRLVVGIGDDAAVWRSGDGFTIATTDTMVEGVHFLPGKVAWKDVGWKALAANISDVAAMGGTPAFALVTLCLPPDTPVEHVDAMYAGLAECAETYGITVAGGDIVSAREITVTVALTGDAIVGPDRKPHLLRRSAARVGDDVAVTGPLGASAGGLRVLKEGLAAQHPSLVESHARPWPRVDAGTIGVRAGITCGMDISDGLAQDLGHICRASSVRAELYLDRIPIDNNLTLAYPADAASMAAAGGEDYELILTGDAATLAAVDQALRRHLDLDFPQLHTVGRITTGHVGVVILDATGAEVDLTSRGWDHLRPGSHS